MSSLANPTGCEVQAASCLMALTLAGYHMGLILSLSPGDWSGSDSRTKGIAPTR